MSEIISATVIGASQVEAELTARQDRVLVAVQRKVFKLCLQLQAKIQGNLASGIGLKSRHGTAGLLGSVRVIEPTTEGAVITGSVEGGGGPTWYGGMWERTGHREIVPVTKRALHFFAGGKEVFAMRVSAQDARPWMKPPFQEFKPTVIAELQATAEMAGAAGNEA